MSQAERNKAIVRRLVEEAQIKRNLAVVDELLADDFVDHTPIEGLPGTRDGVRIFFGALHAAFPDLLGVPPTGSRICFEVIDILTLRDDKIREHRGVLDRLAPEAARRQRLSG
jgi:predicted SnoaL-like aldol condensation-catalyzing enzyme